jgi:TetR/AcrR family transcriptional regulator, transcriptional repressor for nem operon
MKKAEATRRAILEKAFELIYHNGYQATSVDDILAQTKVTKGAFYYHFKNKDEMGLAVINEVMLPAEYDAFLQTLSQSADPVNDIYTLIRKLLLDTPFLKPEYGCPTGNLAQEMAPANTAFSKSLLQMVEEWEAMMARAINNGKKAGVIRKDVNAKQVVYFVMSGYWGIRNFGKLHNGRAPYTVFLKELKRYLQGLQTAK